MDADHANRDRARMKVAELWRPLPWWERAVYLLSGLLFALAFLVEVLTEHRPAGWRGDRILNTRLPQIDTLLVVACFPLVVATCVLAMRRWSPEQWRDFRRLWSMRAVLVGTSILFAFGGWDTVLGLVTPPEQIPPDLPSFLKVPVIAACGLAILGMVLAIPEVIVRKLRAKRQQP